MNPVYSFCESVHASSISPWHLRKLTEVGQKLGGGVDTPSLCGRVKERQGWDLDVEITEHHLGHACPTCVAAYRVAQRFGDGALVCFVSGHLDLTQEEFNEHYLPQLQEAAVEGAAFIVGDARGADTLTQTWLRHEGYHDFLVFHMLVSPRNNLGAAECLGGFPSDTARDTAMTAASTRDIAWVRPGREDSGTARNIRRRSPAGA